MKPCTPENGPSPRQSFPASSCTWEFPEAAHTVELRLRVVDWLNETLVQGVYSRVKGVEVEGFLLGRTVFSGVNLHNDGCFSRGGQTRHKHPPISCPSSLRPLRSRHIASH